MKKFTPVYSAMPDSRGRVCTTLREGLNATAYGGGMHAKAIAAELDWSPSEFTMRVTLSGDSMRAFPANDEQERLVKLLRLTGDHSYLLTLCDLLGYEPPQPKRELLAAAIVGMQEDVKRLGSRMQQLALELDKSGGKKR